MAIQVQSAIFAQSLEQVGDVGHLIGPFGSMELPASKRDPQGVLYIMPKVAVVVILVGGEKGEAYTLSLAVTAPHNDSVTFPVQHKTWAGESYHRLLLQTEGVNVLVKESFIWRVAILVNGEPAGEVLLPVHWDDEPPPTLPDFEPR